MRTTVCLQANTLSYPEGGGHRWVYLNWALGLRSVGCQVIWLEGVSARRSPEWIQSMLEVLRAHLEPYGFADAVALCSTTGKPLPTLASQENSNPDEAYEADLLLNMGYCLLSKSLIRRFKRTALVDIDPGLLQMWMATKQIDVEPHDVYFTIGETVGQAGGRYPDLGLEWHFAPPCVALDWWPVVEIAPVEAPFTTVSHWYAEEWFEDKEGGCQNDKRSGFFPFLELPRYTIQPLELALRLEPGDVEEREFLLSKGWRVRDAVDVASTPWDYQNYIRGSRAEFSCAKPSCIRLQNAWVSDRTLCYLASGRPAVVQHTGPSRFLPDAEGLFRFKDLAGAAKAIDVVASDYEKHSTQARKLAEEFFDAKKVVSRVLERAL